MGLDPTSEDMGGAHEGGGRALLPRGAPVAPPTYPLHPYIPTYPRTSRTEDRSGVPPPQASVATKNQTGPCSGTLPEGGSLTGGHLYHPGALHDEEGVVHPRGWGYVPVAMRLISLSLSLSCSWGGTILMYRELCYYSWILWCFSPSTLLWWIEFSLWSYLIGLSLLWEHLMYVLGGITVVTMGYSIDSLDVCFGDQLAGSAHEPMHRGWHTFSSWLSGRNFGALFEVLCVGLNRWIWDCVMHIV